MYLPEKNRKLLELFNKKLKKRYIKYAESIGPGFWNAFKRLFFAPEWYIPHLLFKIGLLKIKNKNEVRTLFWGKSIILEINDPDAYNFCRILPNYDVKLTRFFLKNLKHDDIFYDIGANYGLYTYLALELCREVHAFEPIPYIIESIEKNTKQEIESRKLFLNNVAISNKNGKTKFYLYKENPGSSSLIMNYLNREDKIVIEVDLITLESYLKTHNCPTFIKMDVEGAEDLVIKGGINFFEDYCPLIVLEVWSTKNNGEISMKAVNLLRTLGYQSYYIDIEGDMHQINGDLSEFVEKNKKSLDNFLFKKITK